MAGAGGSVAEAALEAWVDCAPNGYVLSVEKVRACLPGIASYVRNEAPQSAEDADALHARALALSHFNALFVQSDEDKATTPIFMQMLKPQDGQVHFLYFWRAFGEAARVAHGGSSEDGLTAELETLRDSVIRMMDMPAHSAGMVPTSANEVVVSRRPSTAGLRSISIVQLAEAARGAASMSVVPKFWHAASHSINQQQDVAELSLEEVTSVLLSWLHDAAAWEHDGGALAAADIGGGVCLDCYGNGCEACKGCGQVDRYHGRGGVALKRSSSLDSLDFSASSATGATRPSSASCSKGLRVLLHIYDVSQEDSIQKLNRVLAHKHSPLKLGGVFHAGVEVNGLEWSFGYSCSDTVPGVSCTEPRCNPQHHFRQTVRLKWTKVPPEEIADIISDLIEEYPGEDYELLRRNCCHFADDFCKRLGVGGIPGWVHRLARIGAQVDNMLWVAQSVRERVTGRPVEPLFDM